MPRPQWMDDDTYRGMTDNLLSSELHAVATHTLTTGVEKGLLTEAQANAIYNNDKITGISSTSAAMAQATYKVFDQMLVAAAAGLHDKDDARATVDTVIKEVFKGLGVPDNVIPLADVAEFIDVDAYIGELSRMKSRRSAGSTSQAM